MNIKYIRFVIDISQYIACIVIILHEYLLLVNEQSSLFRWECRHRSAISGMEWKPVTIIQHVNGVRNNRSYQRVKSIMQIQSSVTTRRYG